MRRNTIRLGQFWKNSPRRAQVFILASLLLVVYAVAIISTLYQLSLTQYAVEKGSDVESVVVEIESELRHLTAQILRNWTLGRAVTQSTILITSEQVLVDYAAGLAYKGVSVVLAIVPQSLAISGRSSLSGSNISSLAAVVSSLAFNITISVRDLTSNTALLLNRRFTFESGFWVNGTLVTVFERTGGGLLKLDSLARLTFTPANIASQNLGNGSYLAQTTIIGSHQLKVTTNRGITLFT